MSLLDCCTQTQLPDAVRTLRVEFFRTEKQAQQASTTLGSHVRPGLALVHIPDLAEHAHVPLITHLNQLIAEFVIPPTHSYDVFVRLMLARYVSELETRYICVSIRLLALAVLGKTS